MRHEGGADSVTVDACCCEASDFRMAPLELMYMIGCDINFTETNCELIAEAVNAGAYVIDGRTVTRCAFGTGIANTMQVDLALDYSRATGLAVSVAAQCNSANAAQGIGSLQANGIAVSRFNDMPGLAAMRSVAILVNKAADAVNQGVRDTKRADVAVRLDVNCPAASLRGRTPLDCQRYARCSPTSVKPAVNTATASRR
ncbi:hypothetical protein [Polaromonas sp.]|uniref:hypothetical protein n=1 Tax=Polaromonas sp. TaxID=1869339 RepID=UPI0025EB996D|nr:hypothetical protein [Polaromonas sp.]